jgi:hypothetical protein
MSPSRGREFRREYLQRFCTGRGSTAGAADAVCTAACPVVRARGPGSRLLHCTVGSGARFVSRLPQLDARLPVRRVGSSRQGLSRHYMCVWCWVWHVQVLVGATSQALDKGPQTRTQAAVGRLALPCLSALLSQCMASQLTESWPSVVAEFGMPCMRSRSMLPASTAPAACCCDMHR